jgi:phage gp45-like
MNLITSGQAGSNTTTTQDIDNIYPGHPTIPDRPIMHPFGFVSRAPQGTISVTAQQGAHPGNKLTLGHRYATPPEVAPGESAIYTDDGTIIRLKKSGLIDIIASAQVNITCPQVNMSGNLDVAGDVVIGGNASVIGNVAIGGDETVGGNATITGNIASAGSVTGATVATASSNLDTLRSTYNIHTHPENGTGGGTTSPPNQPA